MEYFKSFQIFKETKEQIKTILLLSLFNPTTKQPQHPNCYFYKLPRDMKFEIFKFISTTGIFFKKNDLKKSKRKRKLY